ncbi:hypothetical protein [Actinophytocola sediminis]
MATATMTVAGGVDVSVPLPRAESVRVGAGPVVEWCARRVSSTRTVVSVWLPGGLDPARLAEFTAGRLGWVTIRMDAPPDQILAAVGLSGREVSADDLAGVADAVLCGYDRAGDAEVMLTATATDAVLAGEPMIRPMRDRHETVWPDVARFERCRAVVEALVTAGLSRPHIDNRPGQVA